MNIRNYPYIQINSIEDLPQPEEGTKLIGHYAFLYIDFTKVEEYVMNHTFVDCCFFGCDLLPSQHHQLEDCLVLPRMGMIFHAFQPDLYNAATLYEGFVPGDPNSFRRCFDAKVYADYCSEGSHPKDMKVTLARAMHDHAIYDALAGILIRYEPKDVIGIMGGHNLKREDEGYRKIVYISKALTEKGKLMLSGGGPGAMEATHVGAWMAGRSIEETEDALKYLAHAGEDDSFTWLDSAFHIIRKYPQDHFRSLSIPTWFYGHEPSTPFATHIAKFFANSVREDMILSIATGGIIFTPGSAGTIQEVFQDASKLHYNTDGIIGPMIFFGKDFFTNVIPAFPFLDNLSKEGKYKNLKLYISDDPEEVENILVW